MVRSGSVASSISTRTVTIDYQSIVADSADLTIVTGLDGDYRYVSAACHRFFGWDPSDLTGRSEDEFVHPDDAAALRARRADRGGPDSVSTSYRFLCRDDSYRWVETTSRRVIADGSPVLVSTVRDITERQKRTAALEHQAATDPLTGLANRVVLMDRMRQGLRRLGRTPEVLAVLYLDLDRFKVLNDSVGHRVGDAVLLKMAERLTNHLHAADTLARLGGDEFVIVAEGVVDETAALGLATRIIEAGREPFVVGDEAFECTVSVGIACTADSERAAEELLYEADLALWRAKGRGRDRAEIFDEELRTQAVGRLGTERMLRRAIDDGRIVIEYQPIIDLRSARAVGAEALVRIRDTDDTLHLPSSFLEVAEETGILITLDDLVLADAVSQAARWRARLTEAEFAGVAINVTARHLADAGFCQTVIERLDTSGIPHHDLHIEVTERVLMEASNSAMTGLRGLRDAGVQIGLDGFGTGYSSLAYLREFPLDFVKIHRSFIDVLERDQREQAVVEAIIVLAHTLSLTVVAVGVETETQRRILEDLECDRIQGFLVASAGAPGEIDRLAAGTGLKI